MNDRAAGAVLGTDDVAFLREYGRVEMVARRAVAPLDGPAVAIVVGGCFRIFRNAAFVRDVTLGLASPGDVLAPCAVFGERSAETGAEALTEGRLLRLSPHAWNACAVARPDLSLKMAASVGKRISRLQKRLEEMSRAGVEGRVAASILELADDFGVPVAGGIRLDVPLSQATLARLAGTTRETCSSIVAGFARRNIVAGGRLRGMLLVDVAALSALAEASL